jgi:hypothetical protein
MPLRFFVKTRHKRQWRLGLNSCGLACSLMQDGAYGFSRLSSGLMPDL